MKFHMTQATDLASSSAPGAKDQRAKREVGFFQLEIPRNASRAERESIKELILRNETTTEGDVSAEGSIKQLKNLLKNHLVVKPACLFDNNIKVTIKVMFASNGQYSETHTKTVETELSQIQKEAVREELDHEYKYRFLYLSDQGEILPLYNPSQAAVIGGGGDLLLTFSGYPGSGFEFCDVMTQSLTRGSQYQTSFLPEMANGAEYKVKVRATYKDYVPIDFNLLVKYLPNLDGKTKFVDLGTHVFYKDSTPRPKNPFKFMLADVLDDSRDDDIDSY